MLQALSTMQVCKKLIAEGYMVVGTVRSDASRSELESAGANVIAGACPEMPSHPGCRIPIIPGLLFLNSAAAVLLRSSLFEVKALAQHPTNGNFTVHAGFDIATSDPQDLCQVSME